MAIGLVIDDLTVKNGVGQKNPMPVRIKDGVTGNDISIATEGTLSSINDSINAVTPVNAHTDNKELRVFLENHICLDNTTITPLGIGGIFLGDWQDVLNYAEIRISVITDKDSAVDGLEIQWSDDGITKVDGVEDNYSIKANKGKTFSTPRNWRFFRIKYTNGSVAQGVFRISAQVDRVASKGSSHRIQDSIIAEDDAILTKAVLTGQDGLGVFRNVKTDQGGLLRVNSFPYTYGIAEGDIIGHTALLKFGTRTTIAANTQSTIWEGPTALYGYMATAQRLNLVSTSASDGVGGTGARTCILYGLDANFLEINETITTNGLTPVLTTKSFIRVYRMVVDTCGTALTNVGTITVLNNASTVTQIIIPAGDGQTLMAVFTIPAGKVGYFVQLTTSTDSNKGARFSLYTKVNNGGILYPWQIKYRAYLFGGSNVYPIQIPVRIPEKTDIEIRFTTPASAGATSGGATFELWYEDI